MLSRRSMWVLLPLLAACVACGHKTEVEVEKVEVQSKDYVARNDSMLYGLACDGCNDSVIVLLPDSGGDPISFSIINARRNHKIFGRPAVGDKMAVMVDPEHPDELLTAMDIEQLIGTWVYMQMPEAFKGVGEKQRDSMARQFSAEEVARFQARIDSLMVPLEYGYTFKRDFSVSVVGGPPRKTSLDEQTPITYPSIMRYKEWHVYNGKVVFSYGGLKIKNADISRSDNEVLRHDTATLVILRRDTMALRFGDKVQGFKLKPDSL